LNFRTALLCVFFGTTGVVFGASLGPHFVDLLDNKLGIYHYEPEDDDDD
jgi:hypothetical protein